MTDALALPVLKARRDRIAGALAALEQRPSAGREGGAEHDLLSGQVLMLDVLIAAEERLET